MPRSKSSFLSFAQKLNKRIPHLAKEMEELMFKDPSSAIVKSGIIIEIIIGDVFAKERLLYHHVPTVNNKIEELYRSGYLTKEIYESFHKIRKKRNYSAHDGMKSSLTDALVCHEEIYKVTKWYVEFYDSPDREIPLYERPEYNKYIISEELFAQFEQRFLEMIEKSSGKDENLTDTFREKASDQEDEYKMKDVKGSPKIMESHKSKNSSLIELLVRLSESSSEAVEHADKFTSFKKYLHVEREIQKDLEHILISRSKESGPNLILLCGSVGDGKSHLLAYLKDKHPELVGNYTVINDATESDHPSMSSIETLEKSLKAFSDEYYNIKNEKVILAINLGVLHNFINEEHEEYCYSYLEKLIRDSGVFDHAVNPVYRNKFLDIISFSDYQYFEIGKGYIDSKFYSELLKKITEDDKDNPFYQAYLEDLDRGINTIVHKNYMMLQNKLVRNQIVQLIISIIVKNKLVVSARSFLNFVTNILMPNDLERFENNEEINFDYFLPNTLFNGQDKSDLLKVISNEDPIKKRIPEIDKLLIDINSNYSLKSFMSNNKFEEEAKNLLPILWELRGQNNDHFNLVLITFIRTLFLIDLTYSEYLLEKNMKKYLSYVYSFNIGEKDAIQEIYKFVKESVNRWQGNIEGKFVLMNEIASEFKVAQRLKMEPYVSHLIPNKFYSEDIKMLKSFTPTLRVIFEVKGVQSELNIDYPLFNLLKRLENGYIPTVEDFEASINFVEFINSLMENGEKDNEILIQFSDKENYLLTKDEFGFGGYIFERKQ